MFDILDRAAAIDLLPTDIVMPGLNVLNLARVARMRRTGPKILCVTGCRESDRSSETCASGSLLLS